MNTTSQRVAGAAALVTAGPVLAAGTAMAWRVRHGIRQPTAEVLALVNPGAACGALGRRRGPGCGRGGLGGRRRMNPWLPSATSQLEGRAAGADGLV